MHADFTFLTREYMCYTRYDTYITRVLHGKYNTIAMTEHDDPPSRRNTLREALRDLAEDPANPSLTDELFELLPDIEAAMQRGASLEEVRQTLAEQGLEASPGAFRGALYRARLRRRTKTQEAASSEPSQTVSPVAPKRAPAPRTKAERDAWAREIIPDESKNPLLERIKRKQTKEGGDK